MGRSFGAEVGAEQQRRSEMASGARRVCIVGGAGYVGSCLSRALAADGVEEIRLFDRTFPDEPEFQLQFPHQAIQIKRELEAAFRDCSAVFHLAAVGMTGKSSLDRAFVESVNVGGTEAVIRACEAVGVSALLYASSINTVFRDKAVRMGTEETAEYVPPELCLDNYSRTKGMAERLILGANGRPVAGGGRLRCVALRFPGVYGIGEKSHLPRIISYVKKGFFLFTYDKDNAEIQWVSGQNVANGFVKALHALSPAKGEIAAGKAYFINDGPPVGSFESFRPLVEVYSTFPRMKVRFEFMLAMAYLMEFFFNLLPLLERLVGFEMEPPGVTRVEVFQIGITHTYSIQRAQKELGYQPHDPNHFQSVADHYRKIKDAEDAKAASDGLNPPNNRGDFWSGPAQAVLFIAVLWALFLGFPILAAVVRAYVF